MLVASNDDTDIFTAAIQYRTTSTDITHESKHALLGASMASTQLGIPTTGKSLHTNCLPQGTLEVKMAKSQVTLMCNYSFISTF